jgi:acetyl-CoA decarbonylase/synthase complex subunit epsilon
MGMAEPWQRAMVGGTKRALVVTKPEIVVAMARRSKRRLMVVGHKIVEEDLGSEKPIDYMIRIAKAGRIPVVATAHTVREFIKRDFQPDAWMPAVDIANRLRDPTWEGLDGNGQYDLAFFTGIPYYMEWLILSGLKQMKPEENFSSSLKTVSLDRFYQPHATWSFPNISPERWQKNLNIIVTKLGGD